MSEYKAVSSNFKWDGSSLGTHKKDVIRYIVKTAQSRNTYWQIGEELCIVKECRNTGCGAFMCVIDEMKEIFSLRKTGTHTINILPQTKRGKTKKYVLFRAASCTSDNVVHRIPYNEIRCQMLDKKFMQNILRRYLIFWEFLGIFGSLASMYLKGDEENAVPISYNDRGLVYTRNHEKIKKTVISVASLRRCFWKRDEFEEEFYQILAQICGTDSAETPRRSTDGNSPAGTPRTYIDNTRKLVIINKFRTLVEKIIMRVDKTWIWVSSLMVDRLWHFLDSEN